MKSKPKPKKKTKDVRLILSPEFLARIDQRAAKEKRTRLAFLRNALAMYLNDADERDKAYRRG